MSDAPMPPPGEGLPGDPASSPPPNWGAPPPPYGYGQPTASGAPLDSMGRPMAEWWKRLVAYIIDVVVTSIAAFIIRAILTNNLYVGSIFFWAVYIVYTGVAHSQGRGQTLGEMALSIKVVDARAGGRLEAGPAFIRTVIMFLLSIPCGIPLLIDCPAPLWDKQRQSWHDKVANSVVIDVPA